MKYTVLSRAATAAAFVAVWASMAASQLIVDRETGNMQIALADDSAEINGYSISSANGWLDPEAWASLLDQGSTDWVEANPSNEFLTELNPFASSMATEPWNLGAAYTGLNAAPRDEDLTFQYSLTDGTVIDGTVEYAGPINDLVLRVDPMTGAGSFELTSDKVGPFDLVGYSIFSDAGSLASDGFTGLGEGWTDASSSVALAELSFDAQTTLAIGSTANLGTVYTPGTEQDLRFEFATAQGDFLPGTVAYGSVDTTSPNGDCNADGMLDINDANCTSVAELDAFLGGLSPSTMRGDVTGDGNVDFSDFLVLSANFGSEGQYTDGDFDKDGTVMFSDFLVLSSNFGSSAAAVSAVPEPSNMISAMLAGLCVVMLLRSKTKPAHLVLSAVSICALAINVPETLAVDLDTRMIVLDAENPGPNAQINNALEARGILRGTVDDVAIAEDVTGTVDIIDFAGGNGDFNINNPYPNGVNDESLTDFVVQVTGNFEIPAGDWTIGFNTDDGGILSMPRVEFVASGNENGATGEPGELIFNGTRGFNWTFGHFTVPEGETLRTEFEAIAFERGGGDGFEVAIIDGFTDGDELGQFGFELGDDAFDWKVLEQGPQPGDFNWDDSVDFADFLTLADNFGTGTRFADGDANRDGKVDLVDFVTLVPLLESPTPAASVPEPSSQCFALWGCLLVLFGMRYARR